MCTDVHKSESRSVLALLCSVFVCLQRYLSELSLSKRSRELVDAAPGDVPSKLSAAPFVDSDSELRESILQTHTH